MSLINQVLNELEQRGAHTAPSQTQIRAVPAQQQNHWLKPMLFGLAAVFVLSIGLWIWSVKRPAQIEAINKTAPVVVAPVFSVPDVVPAVSDLPASKLSYELSVLPASIDEGQGEHVMSSKVEPKSTPVAAIPKKVSRDTTEKPHEIPRTTDSQPTALPELQLKQVSRTQQADAEYRKALAQYQQGHDVEALAGYEAALKLNPQLDAARLALAAVLMEKRRGDDAERVLHEGLKLKPSQTTFSMALARVQVERGNVDEALKTLQQGLTRADDKADYQAFYAALLQRQSRHKEAITYYQVALKLAPNSGVWWMGYGISLQAVERIEDAKAAYQKALATQSLSAELAAFVEQKLKGF